MTAKYLNDSSPKNAHWTKYAALFDVAEVNLMEKQLLFLLDYNLRFDEEEVCKLFAPFMSTSVVLPTASTADIATRASALNRVAKASKIRAEAQQQQHTQVNGDSQATAKTASVEAKAKEIQYPAQVHVHIPVSSGTASTSSSASSTASALTSAVRGIARRLSTAQLRQPAHVGSGPSIMYTSLSTESSSSNASSSSDLVSLVDDSSSTSSSSGWTSTGSDTDDSGSHNRNHTVRIVDPSPSSNLGDIASISANLAGPGTMKKPFALRPSIPSFKPLQVTEMAINAGNDNDSKDDTTPTRIRKPSDTSSVHTITSPTISRKSQLTARAVAVVIEGKRLTPAPLSKQGPTASLSTRTDSRMSSSSTMPSDLHSSGTSTSRGSTFASFGNGRLRSGTMVHRHSAVKATHPTMSRFNQPSAPPPLASHSSSSSSRCSATSSSSLLMGSTGSTQACSSTPSRVGAIFSRMWGAAAANLKSVGGHGQNQGNINVHGSETETKPLVGDEGLLSV